MVTAENGPTKHNPERSNMVILSKTTHGSFFETAIHHRAKRFARWVLTSLSAQTGAVYGV